MKRFWSVFLSLCLAAGQLTSLTAVSAQDGLFTSVCEADTLVGTFWDITWGKNSGGSRFLDSSYDSKNIYMRFSLPEINTEQEQVNKATLKIMLSEELSSDANITVGRIESDNWVEGNLSEEYVPEGNPDNFIVGPADKQALEPGCSSGYTADYTILPNAPAVGKSFSLTTQTSYPKNQYFEIDVTDIIREDYEQGKEKTSLSVSCSEILWMRARECGETQAPILTVETGAKTLEPLTLDLVP